MQGIWLNDKQVIGLRDFYYLFVIGLVFIMGLVSSARLKERVAHAIAFIAFWLSRTKRKRIVANLSLAFEGQIKKQQLRILAFGALQGVWEEMLSWLPPDAKRSGADQVRLHGLEHLRAALQKNHGVILWESNGFGIRILAKKALRANGFSLYQVHGTDNLGGFLTDDSAATWVRSNWVKQFFEQCEMRFVCDIINLPRSGSLVAARRVKDILEQNRIVCVSGDGNMGHKLMPFDFLRQKAFFATGMVSLARFSGATILPVFCLREKNREPHLFIESPIPVKADGDRETGFRKSLSGYVSLLESYVRKHPEQYRNWHLLGLQPFERQALNG